MTNRILFCVLSRFLRLWTELIRQIRLSKNTLPALTSCLLVLITVSSCGLYRDVQATANPIVDSSGIRVRGFTASASIGKNLADLDTLIYDAQFTYKVNELAASIDKKAAIDTIIMNYSDLSSYDRDKKINVEKIQADKKLLHLLKTKYPASSYSKLDVENLSNEIQMIQSQVNLEDNSFSNRLIDFLNNNGLKLPDIKLDSLFSAVDKSSAIDLSNKMIRVEFNNNQTEIRHQNLQNFLPYLGVSGFISNDFYTLDTAVTVGLATGYSISDIFLRSANSDILSMTNKILDRQKILIQQESKNLSLLMEEKIKYEENIIWALEKQLKIDQKLLNKAFESFGSENIDFYALKQRIDDISNQETNLQTEKKRLFILKKRFQYGIYNPDV